jgi:hypothetical protein
LYCRTLIKQKMNIEAACEDTRECLWMNLKLYYLRSIYDHIKQNQNLGGITHILQLTEYQAACFANLSQARNSISEPPTHCSASSPICVTRSTMRRDILHPEDTLNLTTTCQKKNLIRETNCDYQVNVYTRLLVCY